MTDAPHVLVVGAGPAGAALAYLLASRGRRVTLAERQHDFSREFRGEVLMPGGVRALREIGLGADLDGVPQMVPTRLVLHIERSLVADFALDPELFAGDVPRAVSQPHLLEHLVALSSAFPEFTFLRGATVRDLLRDGDRVSGALVHTDEGSREISADLVVGADGRSSVVRKKAGLDADSPDLPMDIVWCKLPWPDFLKDRPVHVYLAGGHLFIAVPSPDGLLQVAWVILKGTWGELRSRGIEGWLALMADHVEDRLGDHLRTHAADASRPFLLDARTDRVRGWAQPGMLLVGDAAHTMSPVGGQGINVALRDAVTAANHLVPVLRGAGSSRALDEAAAKVEPERAREIDTIQRLAALPPKVVLATHGPGVLARALIPHLLRLPGLGHLAGRMVRPFTDGVTRVELRV